MSNSVTINGVAYPLVQLNLFYSYEHLDNFVATNSTPPDATYINTFGNGLVVGEPAPGTVPLQVRLLCAREREQARGTFLLCSRGQGLELNSSVHGGIRLCVCMREGKHAGMA